METKCFENVTDFLGKEDERYFSSGYKHIDMNYEKIAITGATAQCVKKLYTNCKVSLHFGETVKSSIKCISVN